MDHMIAPAPAERPPADRVARTATTEAATELKRPGSLSALITSFLFCLIVTFAWVTVVQLLSILVEHITVTVPSLSLLLALEGGLWLLSGVLLMVCVLPVWLGRLRLAGRISLGEQPPVREVLYYYGSVRRMGRAVLIALVLVLQVLLPLVLIAGAAVGLLYFYNEVLLFAMSDGAALLLLILGFLLLITALLGLLLLSGAWATFTAVAVGNERIPVLRALGLALRAGRKNLLPLFLFTLRSLWHLLLSAVTLGILYMLWYSHLYLVSYVRLSMALCPKKESD